MRAYNLSWDYRIVKEGMTYGIKEVYYDGPRIKNWSQNFIYAFGDSLDELRCDLGNMMYAFNKPILIEKGSSLEEVTNS